MVFEIPASIGAQISDKNKLIISILGDGSFQMNIQELQTIIHYKLPIKILLFNNNSYGAIKITQKNYFENKYGVDSESGISFPDAEKIANAYGIKYMYIKTNDNTVNIINDFLNYSDGSIILEIFCSIQERIPKLDAIKNEDGTFTNRPFEDMKPFINREEFEKEMIIKCI
jgi:acetolactate synthase-1/2/3 large subunit